MYELYAAAILVPIICFVCWRSATSLGTRNARLPHEARTSASVILSPPLEEATAQKPKRRPRKTPTADGPTKRTRFDSGLRYPLRIRYRDAEGTVTDRAITVRGFTAPAYEMPFLNAFCHKRNAERTFYVDRIVEAVDGETGEVLTDVVERMREVAEQRAEQRAAKSPKRR